MGVYIASYWNLSKCTVLQYICFFFFENPGTQIKIYINITLLFSGEVLCLNTTVDDSMNITSAKITGPLTMYPPADDNYSEDACSILVMDTIPPSVVIASNFGELYNCLLLPDTQTKVSVFHNYIRLLY